MFQFYPYRPRPSGYIYLIVCRMFLTGCWDLQSQLFVFLGFTIRSFVQTIIIRWCWSATRANSIFLQIVLLYLSPLSWHKLQIQASGGDQSISLKV